MATIGNQLEISKTSYQVYEDEELQGVTEENTSDTRSILYNFVFSRAERDKRLTSEQKESFEKAKEKSDEGTEKGDTVSGSMQAQIVGRRLAVLGDEIDAIYSQEFDDAIGLYDNPQEAFQSFSSVLRHIWEDGTLPTLGHIAAVFGYCYHLCKNHVQKYINSFPLLSLLGMLAGFLVRTFLRLKVYEWINEHGGWINLFQTISPSGDGASSFLFSRNTYYLLALGTTLTLVTAFIYFQYKRR